MNDKQLKLILTYIYGKDYRFKELRVEKKGNYILDSNLAWECVQEMERKGHSEEFDDFYQDEWLEHGGSCKSYTLWSTNPDNFFTCMAKWLEVRNE